MFSRLYVFVHARVRVFECSTFLYVCLCVFLCKKKEFISYKKINVISSQSTGNHLLPYWKPYVKNSLCLYISICTYAYKHKPTYKNLEKTWRKDNFYFLSYSIKKSTDLSVNFFLIRYKKGFPKVLFIEALSSAC